MIDKYSVFIFDLDGTIYRGDKIIPGADKTVNYLLDKGKKLFFISNKTTGSVLHYYNFLKKFNLNILPEDIINSTVVLKKYLSKKFPGSKFFAIGEQVFIDEIIDSGLVYSNNPSEIEIVIVTLDRTFNYEKLELAAHSLDNGAKFFAANIDDTCPVDYGEVLDAGATISALEKRTHKKLEINFGKPSKFMMEEIMSRFNFDTSTALLIGDRLETDIAMGNAFNIDTALVSTGIVNYPNGNENIKPTYNLNSVFDLIKEKYLSVSK